MSDSWAATNTTIAACFVIVAIPDTDTDTNQTQTQTQTRPAIVIAINWLKQLTLHSATRFQHSLGTMTAWDLVIMWLNGTMAEPEEWWGADWRPREALILARLACAAKGFGE